MASIRFAIRTLGRNPTATAVIIITLGLAIGATTVAYSVIDFLWSVALPIARTDRLAFVASTDPRPSEAKSGMHGSLALTGTSVADLVDWTAQSSTVDQFAAFAFESASITGLETPMRVGAHRGTTSLA